MFYVGQKVVCVYDGKSPHSPLSKGFNADEAPIKGYIYTVRSFHKFRGHDVLWLHEITRSLAAVAQHGPLVGYGAFRFRPLTDISIFTDMLKRAPVPAKETEDA